MKTQSSACAAFFNTRAVLGITLAVLGLTLAIFAAKDSVPRSPKRPSGTVLAAARLVSAADSAHYSIEIL